MKINNVNIYGLNESVVASGYPFRTEIGNFTCATDKDYNRAIKLGNAKLGSGHSQFLIGIIVQFDLTLPLKVWTEAQRYHFLDFVSSCSTMHCITKFDVKKQCNEYVDDRIIKILQEKIDLYNDLDLYDKNTDKGKSLYLEILYNIPSGFELTARMTTNYMQLKTIYSQRRQHKLPDWREFCKWIETLPHFTELCLERDK